MIEEKVRRYKELQRQIDELEAEKKELVSQVLLLMPEGSNSLRVAEYQVRRMTRLSIKTSLDQAREFDAVKVEEVVDKDKLKKLFELGHPIPEISQTQFIQVAAASRNRNN